MNKKPLFSIALALVSLTLARFACAESLATRVPSDAVGFAEWAGADNLPKSPAGGSAFDNSNFKKLLDVLNIPYLLSQKIDEDTQSADPEKAAGAKLGKDLFAVIGHSPTAIYFGPLDFANPQQPQLRAAIFSKVGAAKAQELLAPLNDAIAKRRNKDQAMNAAAVGDFILINIGLETDLPKRLAAPAARAGNLAELAPYKEALAQVGAADPANPPAAFAYVSGEAVLKLLEDGAAAKGDPRQMFLRLEDALHLDAFHQIAWAGRFDNAGNWTDQIYVGLSAQRSGLAAFLDPKPLPDETFKLIPKSATLATVGRLDFGRLYEDIQTLAGRVDPDRGQQRLDMAFRQFFAFTGVDLKADLIDNLTDTFVIYSSPEAAGNSLLGLTLVTKLKDGPKVDSALTTLEQTISAMIAQRNPNSTVQFKTSQLPAPNDKITLHSLTLEKIAPAWAVAGDKLYVAASDAAIQSAIDGSKGSIVENPQFAGLMKQLAPDKPLGSFSYLDLPKLAPEIYPLLKQGNSKELAAHPDQKNPFVLPPLDKITPTFTPALIVTWSDKDGFHAKSIGPFPMATFLPRFVLIGAMRSAQQPRRNAPGQ